MNSHKSALVQIGIGGLRTVRGSLGVVEARWVRDVVCSRDDELLVMRVTKHREINSILEEDALERFLARRAREAVGYVPPGTNVRRGRSLRGSMYGMLTGDVQRRPPRLELSRKCQPRKFDASKNIAYE